MHDGIVPATAFLCATQRIEVGVVGLSIAGRHPGLAAMELASLSELGPGRVRVAVGTGVPEMVAKLGKPIERPVAETIDLVQDLRGAVSGVDLNLERPRYKFAQYKLAPLGPKIPIDVMAIKPRMVEAAATYGDGISISVGASLTYIGDVVQRCEKFLDEHNRKREDFRITAVVAAAVSDNTEAGRMQVGGIFAAFDPNTIEYLAQGTLPEGSLTGAVARGGPFEGIKLFTEEVVRELAIVCPPSELAPMLQRYADLGVDEVAVLPLAPPAQIPDVVRHVAAARP
jgi:alkanesulfonate monooxygenase SsuD/methylene tetrahydromethanopterin reductase-like flavin-dependent oxidoreductase (luciferase family)